MVNNLTSSIFVSGPGESSKEFSFADGQAIIMRDIAELFSCNAMLCFVFGRFRVIKLNFKLNRVSGQQTKSSNI